MEPTHSHGPLANATAPSAGGSPVPDGEDSRRGAEAQRLWEGGCSYIGAVISHCLGLLKR
ncbi:MAG: hypothetical protein ACOX52_24170 [Verrucomicrobiota bacterium]